MPTRTHVARWGNSLALRLPREFAEQLGLTEGSPVSMNARRGRLTIEPERKVPTLDELLDGVTPQNAGGEVDWGPPVGKEAW